MLEYWVAERSHWSWREQGVASRSLIWSSSFESFTSGGASSRASVFKGMSRLSLRRCQNRRGA